MKRLLRMVPLGLVFVLMNCPPALSLRLLKEIPLDVCVFLGQYDRTAAAHVFTTYKRFLKADTGSPSFLSVEEVDSLEEADDCDIAVRISQPGTSSVRADVFSAKTKEKLFSAETSGFLFFNANEIISPVFSALGEDRPLGKRVMQEREERLAKLEAEGQEEAAKKRAPLDKQNTAPAVIAGVLSDVDVLPLKNARLHKNAFAVVIGIENYRQKLPKADFATGDARLVAEYLTKAMGYPEENVITLMNEQATKSDFEKYIEEWLPKNFDQGGSLFFYYSGHGAPNSRTGDAFLVPYDGDPNFIEKTGYPLKKLYAYLGKLPAKEVIVALDSCFSGAGGRSVLAEGSRPLVVMATPPVPAGNMIIMAASSGSEISSSYKDKGHGLFTYFLLKGIKGEADANGDGGINIEKLYRYLKPQVQKVARRLYNNEQTPQLITPMPVPAIPDRLPQH